MYFPVCEFVGLLDLTSRRNVGLDGIRTFMRYCAAYIEAFLCVEGVLALSTCPQSGFSCLLARAHGSSCIARHSIQFTTGLAALRRVLTLALLANHKYQMTSFGATLAQPIRGCAARNAGRYWRHLTTGQSCGAPSIKNVVPPFEK